MLKQPIKLFMDISNVNNHDENKIAFYQAAVKLIVDRWAIGKPLLETTGKPSGYYRLTKYLLEFILANEVLPTGVHAIPEGRDRFNNLEPSFPVDFDTITEGFDLRLYNGA